MNRLILLASLTLAYAAPTHPSATPTVSPMTVDAYYSSTAPSGAQATSTLEFDEMNAVTHEQDYSKPSPISVIEKPYSHKEWNLNSRSNDEKNPYSDGVYDKQRSAYFGKTNRHANNYFDNDNAYSDSARKYHNGHSQDEEESIYDHKDYKYPKTYAPTTYKSPSIKPYGDDYKKFDDEYESYNSKSPKSEYKITNPNDYKDENSKEYKDDKTKEYKDDKTKEYKDDNSKNHENNHNSDSIYSSAGTSRISIVVVTLLALATIA